MWLSATNSTGNDMPRIPSIASASSRPTAPTAPSIRSGSTRSGASAACRERHAGTRRKTIYGLSAEHHRRLVEQQNGVCAICKRPSRRALCVDHCHATRVVRGLLCDKCNTALGLFGDDAGRVLAAVAYLDRIRVIPATFTAGLPGLLASLVDATPPPPADSPTSAGRARHNARS
jgi:hypothetical protein